MFFSDLSFFLFSLCQQQLPATGAPVSSRARNDRMNEMMDDYIRLRTQQNWKFWLVSFSFSIYRSIDWLIYFHFSSLTNRLIDWLIDWLIIDWLIDWFFLLFIFWMIDWLIGSFFLFFCRFFSATFGFQKRQNFGMGFLGILVQPYREAALRELCVQCLHTERGRHVSQHVLLGRSAVHAGSAEATYVLDSLRFFSCHFLFQLNYNNFYHKKKLGKNHGKIIEKFE